MSIKKIVIGLTVLLTYLSFALAIVSKSSLAMTWEVSILEACQKPIKYMIVILPIVIVSWFLIELKTSKMNASKYLLLFIFVTTFAFFSTFYAQSKHTVYASGLAEIEYKIQDVDGYVVQIGQKRLICHPNDYHLLELNKRYKVIYEWQKNRPNDGILRHVEVLDSD